MDYNQFTKFCIWASNLKKPDFERLFYTGDLAPNGQPAHPNYIREKYLAFKESPLVYFLRLDEDRRRKTFDIIMQQTHNMFASA